VYPRCCILNPAPAACSRSKKRSNMGPVLGGSIRWHDLRYMPPFRPANTACCYLSILSERRMASPHGYLRKCMTICSEPSLQTIPRSSRLCGSLRCLADDTAISCLRPPLPIRKNLATIGHAIYSTPLKIQELN